MVTELHLDEMARWLDLPRSTVERWIRQGRMPAHRRGEVVLFDRRELEAWARSRKIGPAEGQEPADRPVHHHLEPLAACLERGGVHHDLDGDDVQSVLGAAVQRLPVPPGHRPRLLGRLLDREELSSTGIGGGVAVPHPRSPMPDVAPEPLVGAFFLARPVDFDAVDGAPVSTLFLIAAPAVKVHLHLMARLAFCLRDDGFIQLLESRPGQEELLAAISRLEPPTDGDGSA